MHLSLYTVNPQGAGRHEAEHGLIEDSEVQQPKLGSSHLVVCMERRRCPRPHTGGGKDQMVCPRHSRAGTDQSSQERRRTRRSAEKPYKHGDMERHKHRMMLRESEMAGHRVLGPHALVRLAV